jgi:phospholipid/cholesterol/gamma-HCH transport system permease protein
MALKAFDEIVPLLRTNPLVAALTFVGESSIIFWDAIRRLFTRPMEVGETMGQMAFIGVASVPIVALTNFFSGAVLALYSTEFLIQYGATQFVGGTVGLAATREIGPVLAGIMVAARCGSSMAAQIGTMAVTEQLDALKMLSVHPTNYLVIPRILAGVFMLPILSLVGIWAGVFGGWAIAVMSGVPSGSFIQSLQRYVEPWDFLGGMLKTPVFGLIVALVACQQGLRAKEGAVGVGRATTNTVVISMVLVYVANYFLADILY